jgi:hypothetical protein
MRGKKIGAGKSGIYGVSGFRMKVVKIFKIVVNARMGVRENSGEAGEAAGRARA